VNHARKPILAVARAAVSVPAWPGGDVARFDDAGRRIDASRQPRSRAVAILRVETAGGIIQGMIRQTHWDRIGRWTGPVDIEAAHAELILALSPPGHSIQAAPRFRAARQILIDRGAEALSLPRAGAHSLEDILGLAAGATPTRALRNFAVLLVHALGIEGLMPIRGDAERLTRLFLERTLLNPLRRANYPFDGAPYDKRQVLSRLHRTIDEQLHPPEPSIPTWLHGARPPDET
jgi:hypothetical protein